MPLLFCRVCTAMTPLSLLEKTLIPYCMFAQFVIRQSDYSPPTNNYILCGLLGNPFIFVVPSRARIYIELLLTMLFFFTRSSYCQFSCMHVFTNPLGNGSSYFHRCHFGWQLTFCACPLLSVALKELITNSSLMVKVMLRSYRRRERSIHRNLIFYV